MLGGGFLAYTSSNYVWQNLPFKQPLYSLAESVEGSPVFLLQRATRYGPKEVEVRRLVAEVSEHLAGSETEHYLEVMSGGDHPASTNDLGEFADTPPKQPLQLLFIHHSCGGQLLATPGSDEGTNCIYRSHPNGGGLRARLEQNRYVVHEASYNSRIGQNTDIFDWLPKFRNEMERVLACDFQDHSYSDGRRNQIVVFKPCFPNNDFRSEGSPPGDPNGPELTVWNAKAAYTAVLDEFKKRPEVLFVCVTAPPLAPKNGAQPLWKRMAKTLLGRNDNLTTNAHNLMTSAPLAREFNNWLASPDGWLRNSDTTNVAVFDYYDILTDHGKSDLSQYSTGRGYDSHPSRVGNEKAAEAFVPFLNRAVRRAGL